jgi:hypothetical protein
MPSECPTIDFLGSTYTPEYVSSALHHDPLSKNIIAKSKFGRNVNFSTMFHLFCPLPIDARLIEEAKMRNLQCVIVVSLCLILPFSANHRIG